VNPETIDSEYAKLEQQGQDTGQAIQDFAGKLQTAAQAGDANAREWLLDVKSIALQIQQEQLQVQALLQAVHDFTVSNLSAAPGSQPVPQPRPAYAPQPAYVAQPSGAGSVLSRFLGGGFGRAITMGAGFGIGNDLVRSIL
jgi:hypothetical protein